MNASYRTAAIPRNVSGRLGLLTFPIGPAGPGGTEAYLAHNELGYGYRWHNCPYSATGAKLRRIRASSGTSSTPTPGTR